MQHANEAWDALAAAVEYPRLSTAEQARRASSMFGTGGDDSKVVSAALGALAEWLEARDIGEAEERYTTLFDLQRFPADAFSQFPAHDAAEVHLATEFQNIMLDDTEFPVGLRDEMHAWLKANCEAG